jgi:Fe-S cluster assembly protein SufD
MSETLAITDLQLSDPNLFTARCEQCGWGADWIDQLQSAAWGRYLQLPAPMRTNENWRFSNLNRIREADQFRSVNDAAFDLQDLVERSSGITDIAGRLSFADDVLIEEQSIDPELAAKGVIFTTLLDAVTQHPELVKSYLMKYSPELGSEKFEALHFALMRNGTFLYVPDGITIEKPFLVRQWTVKDEGVIFPHTIFAVGKHASASLIELQESAQSETRHMVIANAHLHADTGAKLNHSILQDWNRNTLSFQLNTNNAQAETQAKSTVINLGSIQARQEIHGRIFGSESNVELYALNVPSGNQEFDQRTLQTHIAPNSRSDLLFKNALKDKSRTIFSGLIIVEENAQQTDAYQTNNNLMLSEEAESNSLPGLEIKANDVKCSHGATTGRIDDSELFYFLARGIPRQTAHQLMIFGYVDEIIQKLDHPSLIQLATEKVQAKLNQ